MKYVHLIILIGIGVVFSSPLVAGQDDPRLKSLFNNLALSKNADEAQSTENLIWNIWLENKNPPVANVMALGIQAMNAGHLKSALQAFNEVVKLAPTFAEGWNKRATVYFLLQDFRASVKDIAETLRLEPQHFGALSGLGLINASLGRHQAAIQAYEQTLAIHPFAIGARKQIDKLKEILKGEET
jgi:tetratricopeptide (TPR) repeat protein